MNIMFVSGESNPFAKTGGLADVVYALSREMAQNGENVSVVIPFYQHLKNSNLQFKEVTSFQVQMNWRHHDVQVYSTEVSGVNFFFIACDTYFAREKMYSYEDDVERFSLFDMAVVKFITKLNMQLDVVHIHDWQAGMVPLLLKREGVEVKTVLTIHNPAFQGNFSPDYLEDYLNLPKSYYVDGTVRFNDYCSFLKTAIVTVDAVTTVSKTHAEELRNDTTSFNGLGNIIALRGDRFLGIVNGIDTVEFNPATDKLIVENYDVYSFEKGKKKNLEALEKEFIYRRIPKGPTFGIVSRLTSQKGIQAILQVIPALVTYDMQLFVIGEGERDLENQFEKMAESFPDHVKFFKGYSNPLAHMVYASIDFFLMPSVFEPCGIGQMIAMRYGSLPIVTDVGGLIDTVTSYTNDPEHATGIVYDHTDDRGLFEACKIANELYQSGNKKALVVNAMNYDSSWGKSVVQYIELYRSI